MGLHWALGREQHANHNILSSERKLSHLIHLKTKLEHLHSNYTHTSTNHGEIKRGHTLLGCHPVQNKLAKKREQKGGLEIIHLRPTILLFQAILKRIPHDFRCSGLPDISWRRSQTWDTEWLLLRLSFRGAKNKTFDDIPHREIGLTYTHIIHGTVIHECL